MLLSQEEIRKACGWLLENAGPSIRYRTLTEILHKNPEDDVVQKTYAEILGCGRLKAITAKQNADGSYGTRNFHGPDTTEPYLRELFELGIKPDHPIMQKGLQYVESIYKKHMASWIVGLFEEPLGRAGKNQLVIDWYKEYLGHFNDLYENHRKDWLYKIKEKNTTNLYPGVPSCYVLRTLSASWRWLKDIAETSDVSRIIDFLLTDMADVDELYWDMSNKCDSRLGVSIGNFYHVVTSDYLTKNTPGTREFALVLEDLWLLAEFGVIEEYPNLLNAFRYITSKKNGDGLWEFPIGGITKAKAMWAAYHGFSIEEDWRKKQSPIAELTFRICLIAEKNRYAAGSLKS